MKDSATTKKTGHYALCLKEFKIAASITMGYILLCCAICGVMGYGKDPAEITIIGGIPAWALFGVVLPWIAIVIITAVYGFFVMEGDEK